MLRRFVLSVLAVAASCGCAASPQATRAEFAAVDDTLLVDIARAPDDVIPLWPGDAPGGEATSLNEHLEARTNSFNLPDHAAKEITRPTLSVFRPTNPDGSAILIAPGGGYAHVVVEKEGWESARWFSRRGATVYVMTYRLPHQGWSAGPDTPLQDAQRAIRMIRSRAAIDGVDPARVMVMGFSAGGHVAGSLATRFNETVYTPNDDVDAFSARPDAAVLVYPVATMRDPFVHLGSRANLIGPSPSPDQMARYSLETAPPVDTPPVFLLHAGDDPAVPVENSLLLYAAFRKASVPVVLHVFETGSHGFGLRGISDQPLRVWPQLVIDFGVSHGIFRAPLLR